MAKRRRTLSEALAERADFEGDSFQTIRPEVTYVGQERCCILVRVPRDLRDQVKILAIRQGTTVQDLMLQAIVNLIEAPTTSSFKR